MSDLYDTTGGGGDGHENYTSEDPDIYLDYEEKYIRVKTNERVTQSCKRKRARPR